MTPEEALKLRDLAPAGKLQIRPAKHLDGGTRSTIDLVSGVRDIAEFPVGKVGEGFARVLYASHDALATIAACRIEYGVEVRSDEHSEWQHSGPWWDTIEQARAWRGRATIRLGQPHTHDRLVRRIVGPVEVVGDE